MRRAIWLSLLLAATLNARAHRLDECLVATRIAVETNRVVFSFDITPGAAVAEEFRLIVDRDEDGEISEKESADYVSKFLRETPVKLDGRRLRLTAISATFPTLREMREGLGVVRIKASGEFPSDFTDQHGLTLENNHLPTMSVYLVNALKPDSPAVRIGKQTRDRLQRDYSVTFQIEKSTPRTAH